MATTENEESHPDVGPRGSSRKLQKTRILNACEKKDVEALRDIAITPGGFLSDYLRSLAWPILLGFDADVTSDGSTKTSDSWEHLPRHRDEEQVKLDVDRSFVYYPNGTGQSQTNSFATYSHVYD
ncbi:hypothetical protein O1611_g6243 [Lasiodiplodia mahajangana]|uniref:Uncharacterized protein n=1 Tax=Lasiodiplodia mahajangana TaxID=1108764 RepID=A0ACC2JJ41_9PEZI|nr:hypothetical protein O1611_g6243 [Lasiodiplodia mahajangana]